MLTEEGAPEIADVLIRQCTRDIYKQIAGGGQKDWAFEKEELCYLNLKRINKITELEVEIRKLEEQNGKLREIKKELLVEKDKLPTKNEEKTARLNGGISLFSTPSADRNDQEKPYKVKMQYNKR